MSCISFVNGITKVNKENHSSALHSFFISLILESWYIQYLYGAIDVDGPLWHGHT